MKLLISAVAVACLGCGTTRAQSSDCPSLSELSLEFVRIGEDAIYLQTKQSGTSCRWTGGVLNDLPADVDMNCFGQGVQHPVNTTEYCVQFRLEAFPIDCPPPQTKACTTVYAYSQSPSSVPSPSPTEAPTESPAPSHSPTEAPSNRPSISSFPSTTPSYSPSTQPSSWPSVSSAPTSEPVFSTARDILIVFSGVAVGLDDNAKADFEKRTLDYLLTSSESTPDGDMVLFESVQVTDQFIDDNTPGRKLSSDALHVVMDVAAYVTGDFVNKFDFSSYVSDFFSNQTAMDALYEDILVESPINSSSQNGAGEEAGPNVVLIASFVGIGILMGGFASVYMRKRRMGSTRPRSNYPGLQRGGIEVEDQISTKPTTSNDSESIDCFSQNDSDAPHLGGYPIGHGYMSKIRLYGVGLHGRVRTSCQTTDIQASDGNEGRSQRRIRTVHPSFLSAETNIEIPITPLTNYDMSHFSPREVGSDDDNESVPSPANSDGIILPSNQPTRNWDTEEVAQQDVNRGKGFFRYGGKQNQARKSGKADAAVLLSAYGGASSSSCDNYP